MQYSVVYKTEDVSTLGDFGFHAARPRTDGARLLQLSWATSTSDVKEHLVERPGAVEDGYGRPLADVLLEFYDCLLSMPRNFRLVTYHMEGAASLVSQEMLRCGLHFVRQNFENIVRTQGHCLMDPTIHGCMHDSPPSYPTLEELADATLPDEERVLPTFLPAGDECLLYLRLARGLREATLPECRRTGHVPVRSMMRLAMRDNGYNKLKLLLTQGVRCFKLVMISCVWTLSRASPGCFDYECQRCGVPL